MPIATANSNSQLQLAKTTPAIATTTAMITGAVSAEFYKVVQGFNKIEDYKNFFINLGVSLYVI